MSQEDMTVKETVGVSMSDSEREDILESILNSITDAQESLGTMWAREGDSDESDAIREPLQIVADALHYFLDEA